MRKVFAAFYSAFNDRHYAIYERVPGEYSVRYLKDGKWLLLRDEAGKRAVELDALRHVDSMLKDWLKNNDSSATKLNYAMGTLPEEEKIATPLLHTNNGRR